MKTTQSIQLSYPAIVFCLTWLWTATLNAEEISGQVIGIADGDTLTVIDQNYQQHKIRLAGIDAPEKKQPFGNASRQHLGDMCFLKMVRVTWEKRDR